ncbi:concanavalin A-like lectin/glucanase domain-containing protein [Diplogelasinospora grovesii]|uniref:Endo-1,4-beta-xylanase n=1 Tax=Diplogelasinospora grovesii TaxID=303347 RepID=A0AAN6N5D6_9PEZI|nr:concanavalin A-like lectin/glucanase domain-containing protein [Diplogelasinospora grovesii]
MVALTYLAVAVSAIASTVLGAPAPAADSPDFELGGDHLARRQDYTQNYKTGGSVNFSPGSNGYSVTFSGAQDFVVGKGWSKGTSRNITFSGSTTASGGTVLVSIYGWSKNPLVEYYIQEYSNGQGAAQGTKLGSFDSDGSTYDIWHHQQVNQPSISGTTTFWQYISVRRDKRPGGGTVTTQNHFDAWAKAGLKLGSMDYQVLATEGWGNAGGNSKYTLSG